jgi:hypothetical protein
VIEDQLATPLEQIGQPRGAARPFEDVSLLDLDHRQPAALRGKRISRSRRVLLLARSSLRSTCHSAGETTGGRFILLSLARGADEHQFSGTASLRDRPERAISLTSVRVGGITAERQRNQRGTWAAHGTSPLPTLTIVLGPVPRLFADGMSMTNAESNLGFEMNEVDRTAILHEAAEQFDRARTHLGSGDETRESPEGALARELAEESVDFAAYPVVYKITSRDFVSRNLPVPVRFRDLAEKWTFYWLYIPISLFPKRHWGFNRLEVAVEFNPGAKGRRARPKAFQILPAKKFATQFQAGVGVDIHLDEKFEFAVQTGVLEVEAGPASGKMGGGVEAKVAATTGMVAGPFSYTIKKAKIDHTPIGMEKVRWRLDGAEFFEEDTPELIVIVQVPKGVTKVEVAAAMQAYHKFSFANAGLQEAVKQLPARLREFFYAGLPAERKTLWNISRDL